MSKKRQPQEWVPQRGHDWQKQGDAMTLVCSACKDSQRYEVDATGAMRRVSAQASLYCRVRSDAAAKGRR